MKKNVNVLGIVAEYNPMHNGHAFQLEECKKQSNAEFTIAVMSGNFTQRGEPALLDKWIRAEMAVLAGVDLIIELPFYFACNSAEYFAKGAINILEDLGIVTHIGFGSESGDLKRIKEVSEKLIYEEKAIIENIKKYLSKGMNFPRARELALDGYGDILKHPNNILAIEYIKELKKLNSQIKPVTIKRHKAEYHQKEFTDDIIGSGTAIREILREEVEKFNIPVPENLKKILYRHKYEFLFADDENYFKILKYEILKSNNKDLEKIFSIGEGLENKIKKEIRKSSNLNEFLDNIKSKRYTRTRLQRICTHIIMGFEKDVSQDKYIRVLAFNNKGAALLKKIKKEGSQKRIIITNINKAEGVDYTMDTKATDIYNLIAQRDIYNNSDFVRGPVIVNK